MRIVLAFISIFIGSFLVKAQSDPTIYRKERIRYFEFESFARSFTGVENSMDTLLAKSKEQWSFDDSLLFAINIAKLGNYSQAYNLLKKMPLKEVSNEDIAHLTMIYQLTNRFDIAEKWLNRYETKSQAEKEAKKIWLNMIRIRKGLKEVTIKLKYETVLLIQDKKTYTNDEKESDIFKKEVIYPLEGAEIVLRFHVQYLDDRDPVLAKLAVEMGDVIHQHLSLTMAYVAYSIAKHYDKSSENAKRVKNIKKEIDEANYEIIPLKKFFPKKHKSRFNLEKIKEIHQEENAPKYKIPPFAKEVKEPLWLSKGFIITAGLVLILLFVILFVRTRKK